MLQSSPGYFAVVAKNCDWSIVLQVTYDAINKGMTVVGMLYDNVPSSIDVTLPIDMVRQSNSSLTNADINVACLMAHAVVLELLQKNGITVALPSNVRYVEIQWTLRFEVDSDESNERLLNRIYHMDAPDMFGEAEQTILSEPRFVDADVFMKASDAEAEKANAALKSQLG